VILRTGRHEPSGVTRNVTNMIRQVRAIEFHESGDPSRLLRRLGTLALSRATFGAHFLGGRGLFRSERMSWSTSCDGFLKCQDLAPHVHGNLARQVTRADRRRNFGIYALDVIYLPLSLMTR